MIFLNEFYVFILCNLQCYKIIEQICMYVYLPDEVNF